MTTVYASIGNTDNKLPQQRWSNYFWEFQKCMTSFADQVHGVWLSEPSSSYQNACIAIETEAVANLRVALAMIGRDFDQESIAFAVVPTTEFL